MSSGPPGVGEAPGVEEGVPIGIVPMGIVPVPIGIFPVPIGIIPVPAMLAAPVPLANCRPRAPLAPLRATTVVKRILCVFFL